jgi:hypothetical protein
MSFSWQCAARSIIYINFKNNQAELAQTVCENKAKPKSCCAAKCYLEKEIKKEDKRQSENSSGIKDKTEKTELRTGLTTFLFTQNEIIVDHFFLYEEILPKQFSFAIFHPPALV